MTKKGETDYFSAADHLQALLLYLRKTDRLNYLVVSDNHLPKRILQIYKQEG